MFRCPRCLYETPYKFNMKKHIFKKNVCTALYSDVSIERLRIDVVIRSPFLILPTLTQEYNISDYKCNQCLKYFSRKDSLKRHLISGPCKNIVKYEGSIQNIIITINSYGNENISYLPPQFIKDLCIRGTIPSAIQKLIREIHFNQNHPENFNIKLKNEKSKFAEIYIHNSWKKIPKCDLITTIIHDKATMIDDMFEEHNISRTKAHVHFDKEYYDNEGKFHRELRKKTECLLLNLSYIVFMTKN